ncbi:MAG: rhodanese-like domain-containing protein [Chloroflexi bacterium]|nr:rhodanese-like domain-containing protein [Chloroflexota bacterium]
MSKKKAKSSASRPAAQPPKAAPQASAAWVWGGLGLLAVIVIAVFVSQGAGAGAASVPTTAAPAASSASLSAEISVAEAAAKRQAGAFILDVREPEEWNEYHIPGATLISLGELEARVKDVPRDKEVVVVCRSGNRSQAGRDILTNAGFTQVTSMAGGLKDWAAANLPTVTGP